MNDTLTMLQTYGGWGLSVILMATLRQMLRYVAKLHEQQKREKDKVLEEQREETRETVTVIVEVRNALQSVGEAMNRLTLRLEKLED